MFSYYLTRVFFAFSKHKLQEIAKAFELKFNVKLTTYIKYRNNDLVSSYIIVYIFYFVITQNVSKWKHDGREFSG